MKKNLLLIGTLLVGMTMATGCSNEDSFEQNQGTLAVVKATIDNGSNARTSVNELYQVVWSESDAFTVFNGDTKKGDMNLQGQGGATTGDFQGTLSSDLAEGDVAFFPAVGNAAMTYTFKDEYTSTETDAPLYGTYNGNSFTFSPLSAVIRVNASGLTAGTQYVLTITSTGNQALTGEATLGDNNVLVPSGDGKTITVKLTSAEDVPFLTFDAPIPAQTYTRLTISLKAGDADATTLKTLENFTAVAGKLYEATEKVTTAEALKNALVKGGNVDIDAPITLTEDLEVTENTILDLNNQTLTTGDKTITVAEGKTLTIQNAASLARSASGPSITSTGDIIIASANSTITIGEGVNLTTTGANSCCIWVPGSDLNNIANGVTIHTAGNLTATQAGSAAIYVNGNVTSGTINITGGSVKHEADVAVYIAGKADLNISGGEITGTTGVEIRGGSLTIEGGRITATGTPATATPNGNGTTTVGAAVAISQHNTNHAINATIKGGTFIGENALYEADLQADDQKATNVTLSVTGGTFNGKVSSQSCASFITGGTFHDASAFDYLADNANVAVGANMEGLTKSIKITQSNVTIDLQKYWITTLTSDVFEVTGSLTLNDTGDEDKDAFVCAGTDTENTGSVCAVWAYDGGSVTINGGQYRVGQDKNGNRNDCIYAGSNTKNTAGTIVIYGGKYMFNWSRPAGTVDATKDGDRYLLNCADSSPASSVTVYGGEFFNHAPGLEPTGTGVTVAEGKNVYYREDKAPSDVDLTQTVTTSYNSLNTKETYVYVVK